jgi:hypothetical protein
MKTIKIKPNTFTIDTLSETIRTHFVSKYSVTDNRVNEITIAKTETIGCKVVLTKKRLLVSGTFATPSKMIVALLILILGGIIIPMAIYMIVYKPKFEAIEKEVYDCIKAEFSTSIIS